MKLILHKDKEVISHTGGLLGTGPVIQYSVVGMPQGQEASIANWQASHSEAIWKILRVKAGAQSDWTGTYKTAEEALAVLQKEIDDLM
jgi:hypothetical protein